MEAVVVADEELRELTALYGSPGRYGVLLADNVAVPMADGLALSTTIARPQHEKRVPAVLIRTPYGRKLFVPEAMYWASHGYAAIVQDTRSTTSYFSEAEDGAAAVRWIERQPWFDGRLGLSGASYMAFAAWATASTRPACLKAMAVAIYSTDRTSAWYPGGAFNLELALSWSATQEGAQAEATRDAGPYMRLPLREADVAGVGETMPFYQERLTYWADDPHWGPLDMAGIAETIDVPVLQIDGWHDYHRIYCFQDFDRIARAGVARRLVIGPWTHILVDPEIAMAESLAWFDAHLKGDGAAGSPELRWYRTGTEEGWHDIDTWVPPESEVVFHADAAGGLTTRPGTAAGAVVGWTYDPADPTPAVGLTVFGGLDVGGAVDNRELAARPDVRVFTSAALKEQLEARGRVTATTRFFSDAASADLFVRILDVEPSGLSLNLCEAVVRLTGPELASGRGVELDLGPLAHTFGEGHSIQLMVSSGAHPYFDRNLGTGEPALTATRIVVARQAVDVGGEDGLQVSFPLAQGRPEPGQPIAPTT